MNSTVHPPKGFLSRQEVIMHAYIATTTGGTVDSTVAVGNGITSVTRNSAGNYTIKLAHRFKSLLSVQVSLRNKADATAPAANTGLDVTYLNPQNFGTANFPSIDIQCWLGNLAASAAVAKDPPDGSLIDVTIYVGDSAI